MKKRNFYFTGALLLFVAMVVGCGVLQEPEAASKPIEAVPLALEATVPVTCKNVMPPRNV